MNVADIVVIAIVAIVAIVGFAKGFVKSIWGILTIAAVGVSLFFLAPLLGNLLADKAGLADKLEPSFTKLASSIITGDADITFDSSYTADSAIAKMEENSVTKIVAQMLKGNIEKYLPTAAGETITLKEIVGHQLATYIIVFVAGIILTIVVCIIMALLKKIPMKLANFKVMKLTDRLLGLCFTTAVAIALLVAVGGIVGTMRDLSFMTAVNNFADGSKIFQYIYGSNPLQGFFDKSMNIGSFFAGFGK